MLNKIENISISKIRSNTGQIEGLPKNPRLIKDYKFEKLVKSIQDDPEMLELRELIVYPLNGVFITIAGNMRLKAMESLGYKGAPCKVLKNDTPVEKLKAIAVKDNVASGENDWDCLANEWDETELKEWGVDVPVFEPEPDELTAENKNKPATMKITFPTPEDLQKCESEIQEVINRICPKAFYSVSAGEL